MRVRSQDDRVILTVMRGGGLSVFVDSNVALLAGARLPRFEVEVQRFETARESSGDSTRLVFWPKTSEPGGSMFVDFEHVCGCRNPVDDQRSPFDLAVYPGFDVVRFDLKKWRHIGAHGQIGSRRALTMLFEFGLQLQKFFGSALKAFFSREAISGDRSAFPFRRFDRAVRPTSSSLAAASLTAIFCGII
jgi:hypothetical protein